MAPITPAVYVIDDDPSVLRALARLVRSAGFAAVTFADAESYLASGHRTPSCLIVDVGLPGMSGLEVVATIARSPVPFPVIVISARDDEEVRRTALSLGAADFFRKPLQDEDFLQAVERAVAGAA